MRKEIIFLIVFFSMIILGVSGFLYYIEKTKPITNLIITYQDNNWEEIFIDTNLVYGLNPYGCLEIYNDTDVVNLRCGIRKIEILK